jgi:phage shock protein PspC (stress-responsive transcriptional regulator)
MIDGVCGGVAEYLNLDSTIVRVLWILLTFFGGSGILLYIAGMIIIPPNPGHLNLTPDQRVRPKGDVGVLIGAAIAILGGLILIDNLNIIPWHFWRLSWVVLFSVLLVFVGIMLILRPTAVDKWTSGAPSASSPESPESAQTGWTGTTTGGSYEATSSGAPFNPSEKKLYRSATDRKLLGVCGGLAEYLNIDPSLVRILWVILCLGSVGVGIILYIAMAVIVPEKKLSSTY